MSKRFLLGIILFLLVGIATVIHFGRLSTIDKNEKKEAVSKQTITNSFTSNTLHFSIEYPVGLKVDDRLSSVVLDKGGEEIIIGRNGTYYDTLEEFWENMHPTNKKGISEEEWLTIDGYDAVFAMLYDAKIYYIFVDGVVYTFETEDELLFDDLDIVARSFQYVED